MEFLEYMDFLIPYQMLFHEYIKQEVQTIRNKVLGDIYRPLLLKNRADQE